MKTSDVVQMLAPVLDALRAMPEPERVEALNAIRLTLHEVSPFATEPVDCVQWVPAERLKANDYNPNSVAPPEMRLLEHSIRADGYTQPIVAFELETENGSGPQFEVVDGFHRNRVGRECADVRERVHGHLPIAVINPERGESKDRMAATIRHNRARGVHAVEPMAEIVSKMYFNGWSNKRIAAELGMDKDEVLRLKQITGLGSLFENRSFSSAWDLADMESAPDEEAGA